jgi:DNA-binding NarL/FixJ family response regulator
VTIQPSSPQRDTPPPGILIADDHLPTRAWIREVLETAGMVIVGEVSNGVDAVAVATRRQPDVCLLDIHMPHDGVEATGRIISVLPCTTVVLITAHFREDELFAALHAGADGYLAKDLDASALRDEVQAASRGEARLPAAPFRRLLERHRTEPRRVGRRHHKRQLCPEEELVLELLAEGQSRSEIARHLLTGRSVRELVDSMLSKLDR